MRTNKNLFAQRRTARAGSPARNKKSNYDAVIGRIIFPEAVGLLVRHHMFVRGGRSDGFVQDNSFNYGFIGDIKSPRPFLGWSSLGIAAELS